MRILNAQPGSMKPASTPVHTCEAGTGVGAGTNNEAAEPEAVKPFVVVMTILF